MKETIKNAIQKVFNLFGLQLSQIRHDAFTQQRLLMRKVRSPVIFDLGANVGRITRIYLDLMPAARVYAFEPFPETLAQLRANLGSDQRVSVHALAMSDRSGKVPFSANTEAATNSMLETDPRIGRYVGEGRLDTARRIEVESGTLDEFCVQHSIPTIDILKMDIQGAEYLALSGASGLLGRQAVSLVYLEVLIAPSYREQRKLHELLELLDRFGYRLFNLYDMRLNDGQLLQFDAIFLSEQRRKELRMFEYA